jgi:hypothetical protein
MPRRNTNNLFEPSYVDSLFAEEDIPPSRAQSGFAGVPEQGMAAPGTGGTNITDMIGGVAGGNLSNFIDFNWSDLSSEDEEVAQNAYDAWLEFQNEYAAWTESSSNPYVFGGFENISDISESFAEQWEEMLEGTYSGGYAADFLGDYYEQYGADADAPGYWDWYSWYEENPEGFWGSGGDDPSSGMYGGSQGGMGDIGWGSTFAGGMMPNEEAWGTFSDYDPQTNINMTMCWQNGVWTPIYSPTGECIACCTDPTGP